jgi:hypothetical protein
MSNTNNNDGNNRRAALADLEDQRVRIRGVVACFTTKRRGPTALLEDAEVVLPSGIVRDLGHIWVTGAGALAGCDRDARVECNCRVQPYKVWATGVGEVRYGLAHPTSVRVLPGPVALTPSCPKPPPAARRPAAQQPPARPVLDLADDLQPVAATIRQLGGRGAVLRLLEAIAAAGGPAAVLEVLQLAAQVGGAARLMQLLGLLRDDPEDGAAIPQSAADSEEGPRS